MAVGSQVANVKGFKFGRNLPLLNQQASLGFDVSSGIRMDVVTALLSETAPFPDRDIDLAEIALNASTPAPIEFARGTDKVSFSASGGVFAGLGVYRSGGALLNRIGDRAQDFSLEALEFSQHPAEPTVLSVLRWGFSAEARVSGAICPRRGRDGDARCVRIVRGPVRGDPAPAVLDSRPRGRAGDCRQLAAAAANHFDRDDRAGHLDCQRGPGVDPGEAWLGDRLRLQLGPRSGAGWPEGRHRPAVADGDQRGRRLLRERPVCGRRKS
jgi:hypothetical protein